MRSLSMASVLLSATLLVSCGKVAQVEQQFQYDADLIRLEHLQYWTGLVEEYHQKTGAYPFQKELDSDEAIGLVKIATKQQLQYLSPGSENYNSEIDNNFDNTFKEFTIKEFVLELERGLGRTIVEKYDIQKVPTNTPVGYNYFVTERGYLIWTTCLSCGVTKISTLLMDGFTPTVNIVSEGMKGEVTKALTREEMLSHKTFQEWMNRPYYKEQYVRNLVQENIHDSKK